MAAPGEIMQPVPDVESAKLFELHALRAMSDQIKGVRDELHSLGVNVVDVRERVIGLEQSSIRADVQRLESALARTALREDVVKIDAMAVRNAERLDKLEDDQQQRKGAVAFIAWLGKNAPWLLALLVGAVALLTRKVGP